MIIKLFTALLLACVSTTASSIQPFSQRPTGTYRYAATNEEGTELLLRKSGSAVIGVEILTDKTRADEEIGDRTPHTFFHNCFRGQAQRDRIIYVTTIAPPYDPASDWESGLVIEIADAWTSRDRPPTEAEQTALENCIQVFWR